MAPEVEDADPVAIPTHTERPDHVIDRRVVNRGRHPEEAGVHEGRHRLGDRLALVEQAAEVTLVVDPVVGERE